MLLTTEFITLFTKLILLTDAFEDFLVHKLSIISLVLIPRMPKDEPMTVERSGFRAPFNRQIVLDHIQKLLAEEINCHPDKITALSQDR